MKIAISSKNSSVLGHDDCDWYWPHLLFDKARRMRKSSLMLAIMGPEAPEDIHLSVPFQHPEDRPMSFVDLPQFRIRSQIENVIDVVKENNIWYWITK